MRYKLTSTIYCATLLAACAIPEPTFSPDQFSTIDPFVDELFRRHLTNPAATQELSLEDIYGGVWEEFAIFCPGEDGASMAESYGITDHPFNHEGHLGKNERYLYLSDTDKVRKPEWIRLGGSVNFCSAAGPGSLGLASTSETMFFQLTDYGTWERIPPPAQKSAEPTTTKAAP
ncbi:MAG: hypothetical protein Q4D52_06610 [Eubacteriales bacterium]|nr:hypothetical protein [Eubacteriales bacterium]